MQAYLPEQDDKSRKVSLMRNFDYRIHGNDTFMSPNNQVVSFEVAWEWLEANGVSLDLSYQDNMTAYLASFGYKRTRISGQTKVYDASGNAIIQAEALRMADRKRDNSITTLPDKDVSSENVHLRPKYMAIQDWAEDCKNGNKQGFQDWLLSKLGYI